MNNYRLNIGKVGENLAVKYLEAKGINVIGRNYYTRYGEIDLIAQQGDEILFIEVKTRTSNDYGYPEEAVNKKKVMHLVKAINEYVMEKQIRNFWRIDAISIELNLSSKIAKIRWFMNISEN